MFEELEIVIVRDRRLEIEEDMFSAEIMFSHGSFINSSSKSSDIIG